MSDEQAASCINRLKKLLDEWRQTDGGKMCAALRDELKGCLEQRADLQGTIWSLVALRDEASALIKEYVEKVGGRIGDRFNAPLVDSLLRLLGKYGGPIGRILDISDIRDQISVARSLADGMRIINRLEFELPRLRRELLEIEARCDSLGDKAWKACGIADHMRICLGWLETRKEPRVGPPLVTLPSRPPARK